MRIKRHKAIRKTLKFFQVNFGFREPYKVSERQRDRERQRASAGPPPFIRSGDSFHSVFASLGLLLFVSSSFFLQILVDGNFIHAVLSTGNGDVEGTLSKLLMGNVRAFTTRYTLHELQSMGREYRGRGLFLESKAHVR